MFDCIWTMVRYPIIKHGVKFILRLIDGINLYDPLRVLKKFIVLTRTQGCKWANKVNVFLLELITNAPFHMISLVIGGRAEMFSWWVLNHNLFTLLGSGLINTNIEFEPNLMDFAEYVALRLPLSLLCDKTWSLWPLRRGM